MTGGCSTFPPAGNQRSANRSTPSVIFAGRSRSRYGAVGGGWQLGDQLSVRLASVIVPVCPPMGQPSSAVGRAW